MNKDLDQINLEIDRLSNASPCYEKYERLATLFVCRYFIEKELTPDKSTVTEILEHKLSTLGGRTTLLKLEPILADHVKVVEMIAPTISGEFIKKIKEM